MSAADSVVGARATAESMALTGTGQISHVEPAAFDAETGTTTSPATVVTWVGPCLVGYNNDGRTIEGDAPLNLAQMKLRLPANAPPLRVGVDTFTLLDAGPSGSPDLVGRPLQITGVARKTLAVFTNASVRDRDQGVR